MSSNILLVDDSPTVRNIVKIYLMNLRSGFVEADEASRALQLLKLVPVSLIIADINMPGMDGISFCKEVRQSTDPKVKNIPVILLTADKTEVLRSRGQEAGASDFILKPVTGSQLLESVRRFLPLGAA